MTGESIRVNSRVAVPLTEVAVRTSRSSGPGGQHAQKTESRVEVVFDVLASEVLTDAQKERIVGRVGPVLRAVSQDERSQARNRELALERLATQLREALRVQRARRPTKPSAAAVERRLDEKRRRSRTKRLRGDATDG
jgi:ribosome-associated protein